MYFLVCGIIETHAFFSIIARHPALGQAALLIAAAVTEEGAKDRGTPTRAARSSRG